jgi:DNA polymerase V
MLVCIPTSDTSDTVLIPLVGQALCAGFPSPAQDYIENHIELPRWMAPNPSFTFLFKVDGDSAIDAKIFPRDLLVVDRSITPANRHIVVVDVNGERSIKRLSLRGERMQLSFENRTYPKFVIPEHADVQIFGVALRCIRTLYEAKA